MAATMRTGFCVALIAVTFGSVLPAGQTRPSSSNRIAELQEWMALVSQHTPGRVDEAVSNVRSWGRESLQNVRDDVAALRLLMCERCSKPQQADRFRTEPVKIGSRHAWRTVYASSHVIELTEFVQRIGTTFDVNALLKRGALLHTDVALRAPPVLTFAANVDYLPLQRTIVQLADGQQGRLEATVDHLDMARRLLDLVTPDPRADVRETPERDQMVRVWYRATMSALLDLSQLDVSHTDAALQLLPGETAVLFLAGAHHETLAAPRYQSAIATRTLGDVSVIASEQEELRRAEGLFRRAVNADPEYVEAHLLIGREEDARGNVQDARSAYERAAALVARAQAPRLALSEIEMRSGNRTAARRWMDEALGTSGSAPSADPWTFYAQSAGRSAAALLASVARTFPAAAGRK